MLWKPDGKSLDPMSLGELEPTRVLFEFEGPRTFLASDTRGEMLFAHQCGHEDGVWRYAVVPFSQHLLSELEGGFLDLRSALGQPWLWLIDIGNAGRPIRCIRSSVDAIPENNLPQPGIMLMPERNPLLNVRYTGSNHLTLESAGFFFLSDAFTRIVTAFRPIAERFAPQLFPFEHAKLPVMLRTGSVRLSILPPLTTTEEDVTALDAVSRILTDALASVVGARSSHANEDLLMGLHAVLALAPPDTGVVSATEVSGRLLRRGASSVLLRRDMRLPLRQEIQSLEAQISAKKRGLAKSIPLQVALENATNFWIAAGTLNGTHRNWLEIPASVAVFFPREDWDGAMLLQIPGGKKFKSMTRYRGTAYGQYAEMCRIQLPTREQSGLVYYRRLVHFRRTTTGDVPEYELSVAPPQSEIARQWNEHALRKGAVEKTGGPNGRLFGYW